MDTFLVENDNDNYLWQLQMYITGNKYDFI